MRTRVGYAGGTIENPTYQNLGKHSEAIQMDYDPTKISYQQLLTSFWQGHNPTWPNSSRQYASIIFYHDEEQKRLAQDSKEQQAAQCDCQIYTEIVPASTFYLAENYHQKYRLRQVALFADEFSVIYPDSTDFVNSTAAARVNGYLAGYVALSDLQAEINDLGLSPTAQQKLLDIFGER